jgi:hypothetical protein
LRGGESVEKKLVFGQEVGQYSAERTFRQRKQRDCFVDRSCFWSSFVIVYNNKSSYFELDCPDISKSPKEAAISSKTEYLQRSDSPSTDEIPVMSHHAAAVNCCSSR